MLIGVIMLIRLTWMIDNRCIVVVWMVLFILNTLQVLEDLSILPFQLIKIYLGGKIRCPCVRCKNQKFLKEDDVCKHLLTKGFLPYYENWIVHRGPYVAKPILAGPSSVGISHVVNDVCLENPYRNLVMNAMGVGDAYYNDNVSSPMVAKELPNPEATNFFKLLKAAEEPLWDGCTKQFKLSVCVQLLNIKSILNLTQTAFNKFIDFTKSCMPNDENLV